MKSGEIHGPFEVQRLNGDGRGVAIVDDFSLLVDGACTGDVVEARVSHVSRHEPVAWSEVASVESRGECFELPACPHQWPVRGRCGGCVVQHLTTDAAKEMKMEGVRRAIGELRPTPRTSWTPAPAELGYRNRGQFVAARDRGGRIVLGSYAPRSHDVVSMVGCPVLRKPISYVSDALTGILNERSVPVHPEREGLRYVTIRSAVGGGALIDLVGTAGDPPWLEGVAGEAVEDPQILGVSFSVNTSEGNAIRTGPSSLVAGVATCVEPVGGLNLSMAPSSFAQLNSEVAAAMYQRIPDMAGGATVVWDLYCGLGGLGLTVGRALPGVRVFGVDSVPGSIDLAISNAVDAGVEATYVVADLREGLPAGWPTPDLVLVNPPRRGLDRALLEGLVEIEAPGLVYMSCSPKSFARDSVRLADGGWSTGMVHVYDMLPGTTRVELLAHFTRGNQN